MSKRPKRGRPVAPLPRAGERGSPPAPPSFTELKLNGDLIVQEYTSLRNESLSAKQNQQTILQWTLGVIGVIIAACAASTAAMYEMTHQWRVAALLAVAVTVGGIVPVIVGCAFGIWLGEVDRMERAGRFLRSREEAWSAGTAKNAHPGTAAVAHLAIWESVLANNELGYGKNKSGSAASCALFLVLFLSSLGAGLALALTPASPLAQWATQTSPVWGWVAPTAWGVLCPVAAGWLFGKNVWTLARKTRS